MTHTSKTAPLVVPPIFALLCVAAGLLWLRYYDANLRRWFGDRVRTGEGGTEFARYFGAVFLVGAGVVMFAAYLYHLVAG